MESLSRLTFPTLKQEHHQDRARNLNFPDGAWRPTEEDKFPVNNGVSEYGIDVTWGTRLNARASESFEIVRGDFAEGGAGSLQRDGCDTSFS
jgi:hypothetical protein